MEDCYLHSRQTQEQATISVLEAPVISSSNSQNATDALSIWQLPTNKKLSLQSQISKCEQQLNQSLKSNKQNTSPSDLFATRTWRIRSWEFGKFRKRLRPKRGSWTRGGYFGLATWRLTLNKNMREKQSFRFQF